MKLNLEKIIELNSLGYTQREVQQYFGCSAYQNIQSFLKYKNVKLEWKQKSWRDIDSTFFDVIDTELKAYLLGFFYADGTIADNNRIAVRIQIDDVYVTELFQKAISPKIALNTNNCQRGCKVRKLQVYWRITSKEIAAAFLKLGIGPRKTYADVRYPNIPPEMNRHFIRGFFDGDGCIARPLYGKTSRGQRLTIVSTWKPFLEEIANILEKEAGISYITFYDRKGKTCNYTCLNISTNDKCDKFYSYVYDNSNFYLKRKKEKFIKHNTEITTETKESVAS